MQQAADAHGTGVLDLAAQGREFGEEVLEALIWDAVEDALRRIGPGARTAAFAGGLADWGSDLFGRWRGEVEGFLDALAEDAEEDQASVPVPSLDAPQAGTRWRAVPKPGVDGRCARTTPLRSISSCTTRALTTSSRSRVIVRAIQSM